VRLRAAGSGITRELSGALRVGLWALVALGSTERALAQAPPPIERPSESAGSKAQVTPPQLRTFVPAEYPKAAEAQRLQADVVLRLDIDANGQVTEAAVVQAAGNGFDEAAVIAARQFVFRPAERNGRAVAARILYRYSFQLKEEVKEEKPLDSVLRGRIVIAGGEDAVAGATVRVYQDAQLRSEQQTGADGRFLLPQVQPGAYRILVEAEGFKPFNSNETLVAGEELQVNYGLLPVATASAEIVVEGTRPVREVTRRSMARKELLLVPGTSGDALRALQNMPGVARAPALSGVLVVRGNADQTTPVFIDGMWIPNIYHFGGLSAVVPTEMLDEVNFYPGNFSVRYGRALAGVVDAHLRETRADGRYHGLLQVDLIDARAMVEGPIPKLKGWNVIAGFRRSHVDAWLVPLVSGRDTYISAAPVYYDYQLIADYRPKQGTYLRIGLLGFDDRFRAVDETAATGGRIDAVNATVGMGLVYESKVSDRSRLRLTLSSARSHQRFAVGPLEFDIVAYGTVSRGELEWKPWTNATWRTGFDLLLAPYQAQGSLPEDPGAGAPSVGSFVTSPAQVFDRSSVFVQPAVYSELALHPSSRSQLVSGVRLDFAGETRRFDVSPRLNARYDIVPQFPKTTIKGGTGLFHQAPSFPEELLRDPDQRLRSQRSFQNSIGIEQELTQRVKFSAEGFFNLLDNLISRQVNERGVLTYNNYGKGRIYGAEFMLRYAADDNFFGWISYTISRSERTWIPGQPSQRFYLDQPHILTILGSYNLGKGWNAGVRFRYVSGNLYTPCLGGVFSTTNTSYLCQDGPTNSQQLSPFHQLDVRIDKRFKFESFSLGIYLDLINAYNRRNPDFIQYNYDFSQKRAQTGSLPIVPSLGIRGEF